MSKEERTIIKEEIVERFMEDIVGRAKTPWYKIVWWRFYWRYEVIAAWWRNKRQTWQTGFPHEQAWNFHSWHSKTVVPRLWSFEHWEDFVDPIKPKDYDPRHKKTTYSDGSVGWEGLDDRKWDWTPCEKHSERIQEGLDLFGKYYLNLWD